MSTRLLPVRAIFGGEDDVAVDVLGTDTTGSLHVTSLGDTLVQLDRVGPGRVELGRFAPGGYGVQWRSPDAEARTAFDVQADPGDRMRYGFVASYLPGRDVSVFADELRRLHITDVQFYDWAYRHADLLGGGAQYADALGQPIALATVAALVTAAQSVGARALGYAAVYGVGVDEWNRWSDGALLDAAGSPYSLGAFLKLVDPAWREWTDHFVDQLRASVAAVGFDGFHLDQYGYPKLALRPDGELVDVAHSFATLIAAARAALPTQRLVFNNVNDFPTRTTATQPQDAVYIEPWAPTTTLGRLAQLTTRARDAAGGRPVILAAYQSVYKAAEVEHADAATALTMATLFSHGATQLLTGEENRILVDPYYVRNVESQPSTSRLLQHYADFLVEHDEVLLNPLLDDVTASMAGPYNDDCDVTVEGSEVSGDADPGRIWRRVTRVGSRLVVHLINLQQQEDTAWDGPKRPCTATGPVSLRIRAVRDALPRVRVCEPMVTPTAHDVRVELDGTHAIAELPAIHVWQVVIVDLVPSMAE